MMKYCCIWREVLFYVLVLVALYIFLGNLVTDCLGRHDMIVESNC